MEAERDSLGDPLSRALEDVEGLAVGGDERFDVGLILQSKCDELEQDRIKRE